MLRTCGIDPVEHDIKPVVEFNNPAETYRLPCNDPRL